MSKPTLEILEQRVNQQDEKIDCLDDKYSVIAERLGGKVPWKTFWIIITIFIGIVGAMWAILYNETKNIRETSFSTQTDVSYIKGLLNNAQIYEDKTQ